jgi:hypothetical protein
VIFVKNFGEALTYTGGALVGIVGAHAVYVGTKRIFDAGDYLAAGVEFAVGLLLAFFSKSTMLRVVGGVFVAQGVLDWLYAGRIVKVEL